MNRTTYLNVLLIFNAVLIMSKSIAEKRLARLTKSEGHFCENPSEHAKDLRQLAVKVAESTALGRQSRVFKALADVTRLRILNLLKVREMCVCEIMVALDLTQPTASHHLRILETAGLVGDMRKGKWVFYKIANPGFVDEVLRSDVS